jgi:hypothetical protein
MSSKRLDETCNYYIKKNMNSTINHDTLNVLKTDIQNQEFIENASNSNAIGTFINNKGRHADECDKTKYAYYADIPCSCLNQKAHNAKKAKTVTIVHKIEGIVTYKSRKCVKIRIDDLNMPEFWMELNIPIDEIKEAIENSGNSNDDN